MTAITAAIVELKAHCEHTWEVIRSLERFARVVEDAHAKGPTRAGAVKAVREAQRLTRVVMPSAPASPASPPHRAVRATTPAPVKPTGRPASAAVYPAGADIISALGAAREPQSPTALIAITKLPRWRVMTTLLKMHAAGQLVKVGKNRGARYALPSTPRPGADAGTSAAPPVGPPSANGHTPSNGRRHAPAAGDFEVAWNGTKERNGQAPSILPPRERRA